MSVLAKILFIGSIQFILFPHLVLVVGEDEFGEIITYVALMNLVSGSLGNILNNTYLILSKKYSTSGVKWNVSFLLTFVICANTVVTSALVFFGGLRPSMLELILFVLGSNLLLFITYYSVNFRVSLDYKSVLIDSVLVTIGFGLGYLLFLITDLWMLIYLTGYVFSFFYLSYKFGVLKLRYKPNSLFKMTSGQFMWLLFSGMLLSVGTYVDKLILFPQLGGKVVGYYHVATLLPKSVGLIIGPVSGVLLSYLVKAKSVDNGTFFRILVVSIMLALGAYLFILYVDDVVLKVFYPELADSSLMYTPIVSIGILLLVIANVLNATVLSKKSFYYQALINGLYLFVYLLTSMLLLFKYGLIGFCYGLVIAGFTKVLLVIFTYYKGKSFNLCA